MKKEKVNLNKIFTPVLMIGQIFKGMWGRGIRSAITLAIILMVVSMIARELMLQLDFLYSFYPLVSLYLSVGYVYTIFFAWRDKDIDSG
jgi:hypothetical protein